MDKACRLKPGDKVIYKSGFDVKEATVVEKPIDEIERPKFAMGRIDLDNGEYLIGGTPIYDSVDECKEEIKKELEVKIKGTKERINYHKALLIVYKHKLESL